MTARPFIRKKIRKLRHWKQQYRKNSEFIFRRRTVYGGVIYEAGDKIPDILSKKKSKVRRFWEAKRIELAEFDDPSSNIGIDGQDKGSTDQETPPEADGDSKPSMIKMLLDWMEGSVGPEGVSGEPGGCGPDPGKKGTKGQEYETDTPKTEPEQTETETKAASCETGNLSDPGPNGTDGDVSGPKGAAGPVEYTSEHLGGGWYVITNPDGTKEKLRGRGAVDARIEELRGQSDGA